MSCQSEYSRVNLEQALIARLEAVLVNWQTQDLRCKKCGALQSDDCLFSEHCTCGGQWYGTVDKSEIKSKLKIMERVSSAYGLKMLSGVVDGTKALGMT